MAPIPEANGRCQRVEVVGRSLATPAVAPWRQCHASTILATDDGRLLCAWFGGTAEGTPDNSIWLTRGVLRPDGWQFGPPVCLSERREAHWNPVLGRAPDGEFVLFFKVGDAISRWRTLVRRSVDGEHWSPPIELVAGDVGGRGPVKNPPLVSTRGTWIAPASIESAPVSGHPAVWDAFVDRSTDGGRTWRRSALIPFPHGGSYGGGIIQPTLWNGRGDELVALLRSTTGRAWRATSHDDGRTWSPAAPVGLPNNNSGLCAVAQADGSIVCAHNTSDVSWGPRNELALSLSIDDGITWDQLGFVDRLPAAGAFHGEDGGVQTDGRGELSYPTVIHDPSHSGQFLISYTHERKSIAVATVRLSASEKGASCFTPFRA